VVEWLLAHRDEGCTTHAMDSAARHGHLRMLQFLHEHTDQGWTFMALNWAAEYGHLAVVQWLHTNQELNKAKIAKQKVKREKDAILEDLFGADDVDEDTRAEQPFDAQYVTMPEAIPDLELIDEEHFDRSHLDHDVLESDLELRPMDLAAAQGKIQHDHTDEDENVYSDNDTIIVR
jgi:hypothetical protein